MKKKIKICYIVSVDITLKFLLFDQLKFLQSQGYEISVVCSQGKWIKDIEKAGIRVKIIQFKRKFFSPISDMLAFISLFFYFKKEKFDIIHTHTPKASFLGQLTAKMAGVPITVNTIHGFYFTENTSFFKRKIFILIEKIVAKNSDLIFSVNKEDISTAIKEKICPVYKIKYLGGWVNLERFDPHRFSADFIQKKKKKLNLNKDFKIIGIVGRFVKEKGYIELFEAVKIVSEKSYKILLLIVGQLEHEKKDALDLNVFERYGIKNSVVFLGERIDIDEIYSLIDIFVLPSHREGMGLSILEASAMEKPVIATNIRGCREAVNDGKTGILVPMKDSEKIAEAVIFLLENPEKAKQMGKDGRVKIVNDFDESFIFDKIKKEYNQLIREKIK
jgi:glycosyltransferase involved in cell wall biosynthesis